MAKKEFKFRGRSLEELKRLSYHEFAILCNSSVRRKVSRGFTDEEKKFLENLKAKNNVKTHCRDMIIFPDMVGKTVLIHRGNSFDPLTIQPEMIGHRLGEFALTRKSLKHSAPGVGATRSSSAVSVR